MDLRERVRLALAGGSTTVAVRQEARTPQRPLERVPGLALSRLETDLGAAHLVEEWWATDHLHGRLPLDDALALPQAALSRLAPRLPSAALAGAAFFDVETTGLSGGTGTWVFLAGIGTFEEYGFRLRQFFLADPAGERPMLAAVAEALAGRPALVSFNGRRFDLPLLETRLALNRLRAEFSTLPHVDLLYAARRLYRRRLESCRLASLERALLGVEREDDIPGWAIPGIYFEYLRRGAAGALGAVFRHNALDILSLVALLVHVAGLLRADDAAEPEDCLALARWDEAEGRVWEAERLYARALEGGLAGEDRRLAVRRLARLLRRRGEPQPVERLWRAEVEGSGEPGWRLEALVELAKLAEHRRRDRAEAEALTRRALSLLDVLALRRGDDAVAEQRLALEHRLGRLLRRALRPPAACKAPRPAEL